MSFSIKKQLLKIIFKCLKIKCKINFDIKTLPKKVIFISNHVSFLDPILMYAFLPDDTFFALNSYLMRKRWIRFLLKGVDVIEFNPMDPTSIKTVLAKVESGKKCFMFPEGRLTNTGGLMKIYEAPGIIADKAEAVIVPIWIDGMEYSKYFSILNGKLPLRPFPKTRIFINKPVNFKIDDNLRKQRDYISNKVQKIMSNMKFKSLFKKDVSIFNILIQMSKIHGKSGLFDRPTFLEDARREPQTFKDIIYNSFLLGRY